MARHTKPICDNCGSVEITRVTDLKERWDIAAQEWVTDSQEQVFNCSGCCEELGADELLDVPLDYEAQYGCPACGTSYGDLRQYLGVTCGECWGRGVVTWTNKPS